MKVPFCEKVGYALGDGAANLVFQLMMMFQLMFYTDVLGIGAGAAGLILLGARVFDAFVDPLAGILSDRTQTKWGKYRPWVVGTALPFALVFALKAGLGFGGAVCGWILGAAGFDPVAAVQTQTAQQAIRLSVSVIPAVLFTMGCVALCFYPISKRTEKVMQQELNARRTK